MKTITSVIITWFIATSYLSGTHASNLTPDVKENLINSETHNINPKSPASELHDEVDILKLINFTAKNPGISLVEGPIKNYPSYKFRLPFGNVPLINSSAVTNSMSNPSGFTVVFVYRQQKNNLGTLLSINSPGRLTPWFQLSSSSKTGVLSIKYKTHGEKLHQIDWSLPSHHKRSLLAAWTWLSLTADFITDTLRLDLDCMPSKFESLGSLNEQTVISVPKDALVYFRQEPGRKKKFLGSMQVAKVLPYTSHERLWNCMSITDNPTPEQAKPVH